MRKMILIAMFAAACGTEAPRVAPDGRTALMPDEQVDCGTGDRLLAGDATTQGEWMFTPAHGCALNTHFGLAACQYTVTDPYGGGDGCFWSPSGSNSCFWIACK